MPSLVDLTGMSFGLLNVEKRSPINDNRGKPMWDCLCKCGNKTTVRGQSLRDGKTTSCGCIGRIRARENGLKNIKHAIESNGHSNHGDSNSHEYKVWVSMRKRIRNPNKPTYQNMSIYEKWENSYELFLNDMGRAPSTQHQIDRIDNSKGYSPDNCRWATRSQNCRNRTSNIKIQWQGETKCLYEWAEIICPSLGITPDSLQARIKSGWSVEKAFTTPKQKNQFD